MIGCQKMMVLVLRVVLLLHMNNRWGQAVNDCSYSRRQARNRWTNRTDLFLLCLKDFLSNKSMSSLSLTLSLCHTHSFSLSFSCSLSFSLSLTLSFSISFSLSLSLSLSLTLFSWGIQFSIHIIPHYSYPKCIKSLDLSLVEVPRWWLFLK